MNGITIDAAIRSLIEGARKNSGHTASVTGHSVPEIGYMVGGYTDSLIFDASVVMDGQHDDIVYNMIVRWINENYTLATRFDMYIGSWIDKETGSVYIDISQHFTDRAVAIHTAIFHDEIAIWDLAASAEIKIS